MKNIYERLLPNFSMKYTFEYQLELQQFSFRGYYTQIFIAQSAITGRNLHLQIPISEVLKYM